MASNKDEGHNMKKKLAGILVLAVLGLAAVNSGVASVVNLGEIGGPEAIVTPFTYNGTTVGSPTFNRPLAGTPPTGLSGVGTAVGYDFVQFTVATTGVYNFLSTSTTSGYDNFTILYSGAFNPASPLTNALIANDDLIVGSTSGFQTPLIAGTQYFFVTTGFDNGDVGTFTNSITFLPPVPEPGTWVMIGASFVGLAAVQRFRRRSAK